MSVGLLGGLTERVWVYREDWQHGCGFIGSIGRMSLGL